MIPNICLEAIKFTIEKVNSHSQAVLNIPKGYEKSKILTSITFSRVYLSKEKN